MDGIISMIFIAASLVTLYKPVHFTAFQLLLDSVCRLMGRDTLTVGE